MYKAEIKGERDREREKHEQEDSPSVNSALRVQHFYFKKERGTW